MNRQALEQFFCNLEDALLRDDQKAIYAMMSQDFRNRVAIEHFLRLDKYKMDMGTDIRIEKIYEKEKKYLYTRIERSDEENRERLDFGEASIEKSTEKPFMVRVSFQKGADRDFANVFLCEHDGDFKISQFLYLRN